MRNISDFFKSIQAPEHRLAWLVAIAADFLQLVAWPFFAEGGWSPADAVLDVAVAAILSRLLGWHWAFLPTLAVELVPGLDLFPTWTAAVFFVTRQRVRSVEPEIIPPDSVSKGDPLRRAGR
ncbi:MAG TPA: hypothetical protein VNV88_00460 [Candidatus Solibacter sp.]|jgi:hypothetical protein|nr:hypothetical protein [Candidatus Solibacter sp.]